MSPLSPTPAFDGAAGVSYGYASGEVVAVRVQAGGQGSVMSKAGAAPGASAAPQVQPSTPVRSGGTRHGLVSER